MSAVMGCGPSVHLQPAIYSQQIDWTPIANMFASLLLKQHRDQYLRICLVLNIAYETLKNIIKQY